MHGWRRSATSKKRTAGCRDRGQEHWTDTQQVSCICYAASAFTAAILLVVAKKRTHQRRIDWDGTEWQLTLSRAALRWSGLVEGALHFSTRRRVDRLLIRASCTIVFLHVRACGKSIVCAALSTPQPLLLQRGFVCVCCFLLPFLSLVCGKRTRSWSARGEQVGRRLRLHRGGQAKRQNCEPATERHRARARSVHDRLSQRKRRAGCSLFRTHSREDHLSGAARSYARLRRSGSSAVRYWPFGPFNNQWRFASSRPVLC